jgi:adhesin transport system outer membrane protein
MVLLPDPDGHVGKAEVATQKGAQTLDQAWQSVEAAKADELPGAPRIMAESEAREIFKEALEAQPIAPVVFLLYFESESARPTAKSRQVFPEVLEAIKSRHSTDISIVGHTDLTGTPKYNMDLSLRRARRVANLLVSMGVDRAIIEIDYFGQEKPIVVTPPGVPEPRNRRVEITVR